MTKEIPLTQGFVALVDDEDYERCMKYKWHVSKHKDCRTLYAKGYGGTSNGKYITLSLHRFILNPPKNMQTDHINCNGLDNRKANLRIVTSIQNKQNVNKYENNNSKYKGVCWHKRNKKWIAQICHNKKRIYLGLFTSKIEAARTYDKKAKELFGEFAKLNFP